MKNDTPLFVLRSF